MRRRFEAWQTACANYGNPIGADALDAYGRSDWYVTQLSRSGVAVRSYNFYNMWPSSLGAIDLNFEDAGNIEEFEVTMAYSHYEPAGLVGVVDIAIQSVISSIGTALQNGTITSVVNTLDALVPRSTAPAIPPAIPSNTTPTT